MEKIKNIGWSGLGIIFVIFLVALFVFFVKGGVWIFEHYYDLFQIINNWVFIFVLLLIILSTIPGIRAYTGAGIVYASLIWGALLWLFCLFVTYQFWGFFGVFFGLVMAGIGIFATAILAVLFDGQWSGAMFMILNLMIIYGVRMLGQWITSKHKDIVKNQDIDTNSFLFL